MTKNGVFDGKDQGEREIVRIDLILFSMALSEGPEPICYVPETHDPLSLFKITIKSMLSFSVESSGGHREMLSFQPYMDLHSLGITHLFQINPGRRNQQISPLFSLS